MKPFRTALLATAALVPTSLLPAAPVSAERVHDVYDIDWPRLVGQHARLVATPADMETNVTSLGYPSTASGAKMTWFAFTPHPDAGIAKFHLEGILVNNFTDVYGGCVRLVVHHGLPVASDEIIQQCQPVMGMVPVYHSFLIGGKGAVDDPVEIRVESRRYWTETWTVEAQTTRVPGD